jgi:hypothetical protein
MTMQCDTCGHPGFSHAVWVPRDALPQLCVDQCWRCQQKEREEEAAPETR